MILFIIFSFVLFAKPDFSSTKTTQVTLPIELRVDMLKSQIAEQIKNKHANFEITTDKEPINENVEYENRENEPITPINENDPRKQQERFKMKEMKTTRDIGQNFKSGYHREDFQRNDAQNGKVFERNPARSKSKQNKMAPVPSKMVKKLKVSDVFYRRKNWPDDHNCSNYWTHCQDLITPYLTGQKKDDMSIAKSVAYDDHVVVRLIQLLTEDITEHSKDDIHSILYQISNLQLRLFQWDVAAIKLLLNVIDRAKSKRHTFKSLKSGLKSIFESWNLHFDANISGLMKQTRIFRPPCVVITANEGSTKTSRAVRYTKSRKRNKCSDKKDSEYDTCLEENDY